MTYTTMAMTVLLSLATTASVAANDVGLGEAAANAGQLTDVYPAPAYSPYAGRSFPERPLWGDTHVHTGQSMDAGGFGARLTQEQAWRFARGEEITASSGQKIRLSRPLDWLVITEHSDGMGMAGDLSAGRAEIMAFEQGRRWSQGLQQGGDAGVAAALDLIASFSQGEIDPDLLALYSPGSKLYKNLWEKVIADAEAFNDPGRFTALIGFEWTSLIAGANMPGDDFGLLQTFAQIGQSERAHR